MPCGCGYDRKAFTERMITLKKIKSVISAALCICMISAVFTGCGKNGTGGAADGERAEKIAKEPKKISFLVPGYDGSDKDSYYTKASRWKFFRLWASSFGIKRWRRKLPPKTP